MSEISVFGQRLKAFRERAGLSQNQLAKLAGVPRPTISFLESGGQVDISLSNAMKLANALKVTVDMLARSDPLQDNRMTTAV